MRQPTIAELERAIQLLESQPMTKFTLKRLTKLLKMRGKYEQA